MEWYLSIQEDRQEFKKINFLFASMRLRNNSCYCCLIIFSFVIWFLARLREIEKQTLLFVKWIQIEDCYRMNPSALHKRSSKNPFCQKQQKKNESSNLIRNFFQKLEFAKAVQGQLAINLQNQNVQSVFEICSQFCWHRIS